MNDSTTVDPILDRIGGLNHAAGVESDDADSVADLPWDGAGRDQGGIVDREVRNRIRARLLGEAPSEVRVGRFRVLRTLGRGGMGSVHAAYDDQLQREVAIKVLHPDVCADEAAQHRLIREAQAQARLSHPHLVPVFEVGRHDGQIYLAMERVDGVVMREWIEQEHPRTREIVAHWLDVARALVVVHEAGLVHRDIKPANVLVATDGRARLVDFGLARAQWAETDLKSTEELGAASTSSGDSRSTPLGEAVTQSRALVGTPAYMAPEVLRGAAADARSDQYSLCVSLYECVVGTRPYRRGPRLERGEPIERGSLSRSLHALLRKGLTWEPTHRFATMADLVAALEPIVTRRPQRRMMVAAGVLGALAVGGLSVAMMSPPAVVPPDPCASVGEQLDGLWNESRREAIRAGVLATELPYATSAARWLESSVDGVAEQWRTTRRDVCEAQEVDRSLSARGAARALTCLEEQRDTLDALLTTAADVRVGQMTRLVRAVDTLGAPRECLTRARAATEVEPPPPAQRESVATLAKQIRHTLVYALVEGPQGHLETARRLHAEAETLGYTPLVAEASLGLGLALLSADDPAGRDLLERAANQAEEVGDLATREQALQGLVKYALGVEASGDDARRALERDWAVVERMGRPPNRYARVLARRSLLLTMEGDYDAAEQDLRTLLELTAELGPAHAPQEITAWHYLGSLLAARGLADEAADAFANADRRAAIMGVPTSVMAQGGLLPGRGALLRGLAKIDVGEFGEAERWLEQATQEIRAAYGDDSVPEARVHMAQAKAAMARGGIDEVLAHASAADRIVRRWLGPDNALRIDALSAVGTVAFYQGDAAASVAAFEDAVRLAEATLPHTGLMVATQRSNLGEALVLAGDDARARPLLEAALSSMEEQLGRDDARIALPAQGLADIAWRSGDLERAARYGERTLEIREHHDNDPPELARTRWLVARIEAAQGHHARAQKLADEAYQAFSSLGAAFEDQVEQIETWRQAQR